MPPRVAWRTGRHPRSPPSAFGNAAITLPRGIGQTDGNGYFQVDAGANDILEFASGDGGTCKVPLAGVETGGDYARLGKVVCQ